MNDATSPIMARVHIAQLAIEFGNFGLALAIQAELENSQALGAAIGAMIVSDTIRSAMRKRERAAA